mgnify:CR=1 FL=1|jgi:hypothetical protein
MKVEIFTAIKNEEDILPFFINHYINAFPECIINIYDNNSTDKSVEICKANNCNVFNFPDFIPYVKEELLTDLKNNIWKNSNADWIIVCDVDELLDISMSDLLHLQENVSIIKTQGYNMIDVTEDDLPIEKLTYAAPSESYSKLVMFKNKIINEINYSLGAHTANPQPNPVYSNGIYKLLHYNSKNFTLKNLLKFFLLLNLDKTQIESLKSSCNIVFNDYLSKAIKVL